MPFVANSIKPATSRMAAYAIADEYLHYYRFVEPKIAALDHGRARVGRFPDGSGEHYA